MMTYNTIVKDSPLWKKQRIFTLNGIISQLITTRLNRTLNKENIPFAQFVLLQHFSHNPDRGWTISQLAEVMETQQPGITKTIKRLMEKEFLSMKLDEKNKRKKFFFITPLGLEQLLKVLQGITPELESIFKEWRENDIQTLLDLLNTLKTQLDENREV